MIALDTDVLAIYHIFRNDKRYRATRAVFDKLGNQPVRCRPFNKSRTGLTHPTQNASILPFSLSFKALRVHVCNVSPHVLNY
jgi:hypothetical protein